MCKVRGLHRDLLTCIWTARKPYSGPGSGPLAKPVRTKDELVAVASYVCDGSTFEVSPQLLNRCLARMVDERLIHRVKRGYTIGIRGAKVMEGQL